jgi:hypothetical protein
MGPPGFTAAASLQANVIKYRLIGLAENVAEFVHPAVILPPDYDPGCINSCLPESGGIFASAADLIHPQVLPTGFRCR